LYPVGYGGLIMILMIVGIIVYIVIGMMINKFIRKFEGSNIFPNKSKFL
jgi:uncharacterized protein YqhQ